VHGISNPWILNYIKYSAITGMKLKFKCKNCVIFEWRCHWDIFTSQSQFLALHWSDIPFFGTAIDSYQNPAFLINGLRYCDTKNQLSIVFHLGVVPKVRKASQIQCKPDPCGHTRALSWGLGSQFYFAFNVYL
jgi:hypothetical protein